MLEPLDPSQAPDSWLGLALLLGGQAPDHLSWKEAPWLDTDSILVKQRGVVEAFSSYHDPHLKRIEEAMNQWIATKKHPALPDFVDFLYKIRFHAIAPYLATLENQFPYPNLPYEEILKYYLITIWRTQAPYLALGFSIPDIIN